jgi:signal transduction histidine kinase
LLQLAFVERYSTPPRSTSVTIEQAPGGVHVCIRDDGRGFDLAQVPDNRFGLEGIRQRCRLAGAEPRIESAPGKGTVIDVVLPLEVPRA